ncbi:MAG: hypothetical protein NZ942_00030 [Candidatus Aenigmarchaeota archaeon]|nr:hypothetical protein [Candidatus Aenigmarchaeota archaeon]
MDELTILRLILNFLFGSLWIILSFLGTFAILSLYRILLKKKEISMISLILKPKEMANDMKIFYYACVINMIGFLCSLPDILFYNKNVMVYTAIGILRMTTSSIFGFLLILIFLKWWWRFKKYV